MPKILTSSVLSYIRFFAKKALARHQPTIIGIAGSVGKTSTRNALEAILRDHFPTKSIGNSETGIPLGILGLKPEDYSKFDWIKMIARSPLNLDYLKGTKLLVAEMGIDEPDAPKNMEYLLTILQPNIAVSLNASATHSLQFDKTVSDKSLSPEERLQAIVTNIAIEDTKIITQSGAQIGVYNADDKYIPSVIARSETTKQSQSDGIATASLTPRNDNDCKLLSFGTKSTNDISFGTSKVSLRGSQFQLYIKNDEKLEEVTLIFPHHILPTEYREVFAAAILVARTQGLTIKQIKESLEKNYQPPKGRSTLFEGINNSVIIDSTYNASRVSVEAFLDLVDTLKKETNRPVVLLLADMRELGKEAQIEHMAVAEKLIGIVDYLYLVGPLTREHILPVVQLKESSFKEIRWFDSSTRAGEFLKENLPENSIILAKGSQNTLFLEEAVKMLLKDEKDAKNLCRQDEFWMKIKK
jgi:UDP-N-acetylmuramyl pentapeptide synthase